MKSFADGGKLTKLEEKIGRPVLKTQSADVDALLAAETRENLLDLSGDYTLQERIAYYDIWVKKSIQEKSGYSNQYGILADLLRDEKGDFFQLKSGIQLPAGDYKITHILSENLEQTEAKVQIYCYGEVKEEKQLLMRKSEEATVMQYQIKVPEDSEWEFVLQLQETCPYTEKIFIQKVVK